MDDKCKAAVSHISRIQGQMNTLKKYIEDNQSCEKVVQLTVSIVKSFDSLKGRLVEGYIARELFDGKKMSAKEQAEIEVLMRLVKS